LQYLLFSYVAQILTRTQTFWHE